MDTDAQNLPLMDQDQVFEVDTEDTKRMFQGLRSVNKDLMEQRGEGSGFGFDDNENSQDSDRPGAQFVGGYQSVSDEPEL